MGGSFDRVNHDRLMHRLKQHVPDTVRLRLINRSLKAGVYVGDPTEATTRGVPQGGPLSPVLSNGGLEEWDGELERRGHRLAKLTPMTATSWSRANGRDSG